MIFGESNPERRNLIGICREKALAPNCRAPELARFNSQSGDKESVIIYYLPSAAGAVVVVVVVVGSTVLVAAGVGVAGEGVVTLVVVEVVASFSLLQPANNAKVTKPVAIIALVFIVLSYCFKFSLGLIPEKFQVNYNPNTKRALFCKKGFSWVAVGYLHYGEYMV